MCQRGHFYLQYVATSATLPDEICTPLRDRVIYHATDSASNANTPFGKTANSCLGQISGSGLSVSRRRSGIAGAAARASTHSSGALVRVRVLLNIRVFKKRERKNLRNVCSLVTSLQEAANKLGEEVFILCQQCFLQLLTPTHTRRER